MFRLFFPLFFEIRAFSASDSEEKYVSFAMKILA